MNGALEPFRTENGFYLGDAVKTPDGRTGCLDEIVVQQVRHFLMEGGFPHFDSVVRIDDEYWLDGELTRV